MIETLASLALAGGHDINQRATFSDAYRTPHIKAFLRGDELIPYGRETIGGIRVSPETALAISTVWRCMSIRAEGFAGLPLLTYRRLEDGGKELHRGHYAFKLLSQRVNNRMTAYRWKRLMIMWMLGWGNAFSVMQLASNGRVTALWPIHPKHVQYQPELDNYLVWTANGKIEIPADIMLHFRALEQDEWGMGMSVVAKAAESLGVALAQENYGAAFYRRGATMSGYFTIPESLGETAKIAAYKRIEQEFGGPGNSRKIGILDGGTEFNELSIKPVDAEFLGSRKFSRTEISSWFGVPLHMLGDMEGTKYGNLTEQHINFARHTLGPDVNNIESEINNSLFSEMESNSVFVQVNMDSLLRSDPKTRNEIANIQRQNGILSTDEWRLMEGLNPIGGEEGNARLINGNMITPSAAMAATKTNKEQVI